MTVVASFQVSAREPLLDILKGELEYEFRELSGPSSAAAPYHMSFRVSDNHRRAVSASFGVASGGYDIRERAFKPLVRLGSPDFDNFRENPEGGR